MFTWALGALVFGVVLGAGCSEPDTSSVGGAGGATTSSTTSTCPNDLPEMCPSPEPLYSTEVEAIIADRCLTCHSPNGSGESTPLTKYADVFARRTTVLTRVYACKMPPAGAPKLTPSERAALLGWLVCGAKDN